MKKSLTALALALFGVVWLGSSGVTALDEVSIDYTDNPRHCYEQEPFQEYQWQRIQTDPTFIREYEYQKPNLKTQYEIDKYTRESTRTSSQHYSWNGGNRALDNPPTVVPPHEDWQANTKHEPHNDAPVGLHVQGGSERNASWFYFVPFGEWSDWSTPTRWPGNTHLAWVDVVPPANWQKHGNWTDTYQRQWTEYPTGATHQIPDGTYTSQWFTSDPGEPWMPTGNTRNTLPGEPQDTVFYYTGDEVGSPRAADAIWTETNPGEPWTLFQERTSSRNVEVECPPVTTTPTTTVPPTTVPPTTTPETTVPGETTTTTTVVIATDIPPTTPPAQVTTPTGDLPATGGSTRPIAWLAGAVLLAGLIALAIAWVRPDYPDQV